MNPVYKFSFCSNSYKQIKHNEEKGFVFFLFNRREELHVELRGEFVFHCPQRKGGSMSLLPGSQNQPSGSLGVFFSSDEPLAVD